MAHKVESWVRAGYTDREIALMYNGGEPRAKKGVNKYGAAYDSGAYATAVVSIVR